MIANCDSPFEFEKACACCKKAEQKLIDSLLTLYLLLAF